MADDPIALQQSVDSQCRVALNPDRELNIKSNLTAAFECAALALESFADSLDEAAASRDDSLIGQIVKRTIESTAICARQLATEWMAAANRAKAG